MFSPAYNNCITTESPVMDSSLKYQGTQFTSNQPTPTDQNTLNTLIRTVHQSVPSDRIRKGPKVILRAAVLNDDIKCTRKFGEGSKPLFERGDAIAKSKVEDANDESIEDSTIQAPSTSKSSHQHNVKKTQSPVATHSKKTEYKHRGCCGKLPIPKSSNNRSTSPTRNRVPYYRDNIRERDRLRRLYGVSRRSKSRSPSPACSSRDRSRRRRRSTSRDKHRDYSPYRRTRSNSNNGHRSKRSSSRTHSSRRECSRHKESSRSSRCSRSPHCSHNRHLNDGHRSSRSHSSQRQHASSSRDKDNARETKNDEKQESMNVPPASMYIPVPVPVPDYAYPFPHWPLPQNPWVPQMHHRAPAAPYGYSLVPVMPPMRTMHPIRYTGPPLPMAYAPNAVYRPRLAHRHPHPKQNMTNAENRRKQQDKHK